MNVPMKKSLRIFLLMPFKKIRIQQKKSNGLTMPPKYKQGDLIRMKYDIHNVQKEAFGVILSAKGKSYRIYWADISEIHYEPFKIVDNLDFIKKVCQK